MATNGGNWSSARELLNEAADTIADRGATYGHYDLTMLRTSKLWSDFLEREIEPMDVAICMALVKLARIMETGRHPDSWLDAVAYLAQAGHLAVKDWDDLDA
jgi:predicted metal-dependent hydrolase